ncbi:MAG TPA: hypothetical protein VEA69_10525 [Tepidisphaeraceae bacterium]|nr:hypothetical protein [Tepidisphaeraceae bacterium]
MSLLDTLNTQLAADRGRATAAYAALLARHAAPDPGDVDELRAAMTTLGLSAADVAADVRALEAMRTTAAQVWTPEQIERRAADAAAARAAVAADLRGVLAGIVATLDAEEAWNLLGSLAASLTPEQAAAQRAIGERWQAIGTDPAEAMRAENRQLREALDAVRSASPRVAAAADLASAGDDER